MSKKIIMAIILGAVLSASTPPRPAEAGDRTYEPDCRYSYYSDSNTKGEETEKEGWLSMLQNIIMPWSKDKGIGSTAFSRNIDTKTVSPDTPYRKTSKQAIPNETGMELKLRVRVLAKQILANNGTSWPNQDMTLVVTTFVDLNQLYKTTNFGRLLAEQMIGELQKKGINTIDVRLANSLQIKEGYGEYGLSREMAELNYVHNAQARLVGTYSVADRQVVINARILYQEDGRVLSSGSIILPKNKLIAELLQNSSRPVSDVKAVMVESFDQIGNHR